jgi:hypothetical protein
MGRNSPIASRPARLNPVGPDISEEATMTGTSPDGHIADNADTRQAAARLRRLHLGWVIIVLPGTRHYRAYPLFRAPRGTALTAGTPEDLTAQISQVEQAARRSRARSSDMDS